MIDPPRLRHSHDEFERTLIRSAELDVAPARALHKTLGAMGAGLGTTLAAGSAAGSVGGGLNGVVSAVNSALLKWLGIGVVGGLLTVAPGERVDHRPAPTIALSAPSLAFDAPTAPPEQQRPERRVRVQAEPEPEPLLALPEPQLSMAPSRRRVLPDPAVIARVAREAGSVKADYGMGRRGVGRGGLGEAFGVPAHRPPSRLADSGALRVELFGSSLSEAEAKRRRISAIGVGPWKLVPPPVEDRRLQLPEQWAARDRFGGFVGYAERPEAWHSALPVSAADPGIYVRLIRYTGRLTIDEPGEVQFRLDSGSPALVRLEGEPLVAHRVRQGEIVTSRDRWGEATRASRSLRAGTYRLELLHWPPLTEPGDFRRASGVQLYIQRPGEPEELWGSKR